MANGTPGKWSITVRLACAHQDHPITTLFLGRDPRQKMGSSPYHSSMYSSNFTQMHYFDTTTYQTHFSGTTKIRENINKTREHPGTQFPLQNTILHAFKTVFLIQNVLKTTELATKRPNSSLSSKINFFPLRT